MLRAGDLYIGPYPPGSSKPRRFIILCDEVAEDDEVAWVYVSTSMSDPTAILPNGCHPDIVQDCCAIYEEAAIVKVSALQSALQMKALTRSPVPLQTTLLEQVQEGVFESEDTPTRVVRFCTDRI